MRNSADSPRLGSVRSRVLLPLMAAMLAMIAGFAFSLHELAQRDISKGSTDANRAALERVQWELDHHVSRMRSALAVIAMDEALRSPFLAGDMDALLERAKALLERLHEHGTATHLYFLSAERECLLRAHQPDRRGDTIDRHTAMEAQRTGKLSHGIEMGPLGTFTLRVVLPWRYGDRIIGYIELGDEIGHVIEHVSKATGTEFYVGIDKALLERESWEQGQQMLGRKADWDRFPASVVAYQTLGEFPDEMAALLAKGEQGYDGAGVQTSLAGRSYRLAFCELRDARHRKVGYFIALRDVTATEATLHRQMLMGGLICLAVGAGLFGVFYGFLGRVDTTLVRRSSQLEATNRELRENEERFRTSVETLLDGFGIFSAMRDDSGRIVGFRCEYINEAGCRMNQRTREEQIGHSMLEFLPAHKETGLFEEYVRTVETGEALVEESLLYEDVCGGGQRLARALDVRATRLGDGFAVAWRDVTKRKRAEQALRESEAQYRTLTESLDELIYRADPDTFLTTYVNKAVEGIYGYTVEEWLGDPTVWVSSIHPEDKEGVLAWLAEAQRTMAPGAVEYRITRRDKTVRWVEDHASWEKDQQGKAVSLNGVLYDITERKALQTQLLHAQKMQSVGLLAGGVAHDFNNILTGIWGFTGFALGEAEEGSQQHKDLGEVARLARRAGDLTRQLLAFSRRQPLEPRILNINGVLRDATKMLKRLLGEHIDIEFVPADDLGNVKADPGQIEQILTNLAVNARDAMRDGGRLTIETANVELGETDADRHEGVTPGPYVMLAVSDNGHGMDEATRDRIFEPFFTTKEQGKGTGLGLATVYGVVRQHNGDISVYSEPGKGTTFKVYLPKVDEPVQDTGASVSRNLPGGLGTILVVDDEASVCAVVQRALGAMGYTVYTAGSPSEADQALAEHGDAIDLLLTDVILPERNGRLLYESAREKYPRLRVLYMSGYTDDVIVHHGVVDSGTAFLPKPLHLADLARKLSEVMGAADDGQ